jgi:hypothetical protein
MKVEFKRDPKRKRKRPYVDFSKKIVNRIFCLSIIILIFICYEIHNSQDLSSLQYLIDGLCGLLKVVVAAYMVRALFKDKANVDLFFSENMSKLKQKFGDDFIQDKVDGVNTNILN